HIALSVIRNLSDTLGIDKDFYKIKDLHIHFPEGAVPKDGPSAGVAMCCALASALSGTPADRTVAMTGEVSLHGKVLPIGGLREKTMAAYASGIKTVLIPQDNEKDLDEIDPEAKEHLHFVFLHTVEEALSLVLPELGSKQTQQQAPAIPLPVATERKEPAAV
ncbi:MAG: endopeptidase La, partial [Clostridia bacterium]|nr:endopeptidase La [Clostridia bacterium]